MESLPFQKLAYDMAEDAFADSGIMNRLINVLDEENAAVIEAVSQAPDKGAAFFIPNVDSLLSSGQAGKMLWALVRDDRPQVNEYAAQLTAEIEKFLKKGPSGNELAAKGKKKPLRPAGVKNQIAKLLRHISILERDRDSGKETCRFLERENKRLVEKNSAQQAQLDELRHSSGELAREKGLLNKLAEKSEDEIARLGKQIAELKNAMAVGPKMRLKAAIRHLEKENKGLAYALEKERQQMNEKVKLLEEELFRLKHDFQEMRQEKEVLSSQIEEEKQKCAALRTEHQPIPEKREPPAPKEKGMRLGIFIDNQNVYYSARAHFGRKLDYQKLLPALVKNRHLVKALCYVVEQPEGGQENFIAMLKSSGYTVRTRELIRRADGSAKGNWDIGIAADVITMVDKNSLDVVVLVTCDGDFVDLIKLLAVKGVRTEVVGFSTNMAMALKAEADDYYFITEDLMLDKALGKR